MNPAELTSSLQTFHRQIGPLILKTPRNDEIHEMSPVLPHAERPYPFDVVLHTRVHMRESLFDFSRHCSILWGNRKHHTKNSQSQALGPPYPGSPSIHHLPRIARTPSNSIPRLQSIQIDNKSLSESQFFTLRHSNPLRNFAISCGQIQPPSIEMKSLAPLSHQCPHNHSERRPLPDLVERVALLSSTLRLPNSTRSTGHRLTTYSLRSHEYRNLCHSALSSRFVPQSSVSWRLAPVRNLCSPMQSALYPADGRCPRPQEDRLDLRSFSGPGHSNWLLLQTNWRCAID